MPPLVIGAALAKILIVAAGVIISLYLVNKIASHFDNTAAGAEYSKDMLARQQIVMSFMDRGMTHEQAERAAGPPPQRPKQMGMGWGLPAALVGLGLAAVGTALFGPKVWRMFRPKSGG